MSNTLPNPVGFAVKTKYGWLYNEAALHDKYLPLFTAEQVAELMERAASLVSEEYSSTDMDGHADCWCDQWPATQFVSKFRSAYCKNG